MSRVQECITIICTLYSPSQNMIILNACFVCHIVVMSQHIASALGDANRATIQARIPYSSVCCECDIVTTKGVAMFVYIIKNVLCVYTYQ